MNAPRRPTSLAGIEPISVKLLNELLSYEPKTGILTWKARSAGHFTGGVYPPQRRVDRWNARYSGRPAGCDNGGGYLAFKVNRVTVKCHRAAWALYYGRWPDLDIDHINGNRSDNRIENLREADRTTNNRNAAIRSDNKTGVSGVTYRRGRYVANIRGGGKQIHVGVFDCIEDAAAARKLFESSLGYSVGHGRIAK